MTKAEREQAKKEAREDVVSLLKSYANGAASWSERGDVEVWLRANWREQNRLYRIALRAVREDERASQKLAAYAAADKAIAERDTVLRSAAPALPREVAMRVGRDVWREFGGVGNTRDLDAIVSRHLPTDEEREAERAVVEAALAMRHTFPAGREWTREEVALYNAAALLLAIRAKRGAR